MQENILARAPKSDAPKEAWDAYRAEEARALPTCKNHPGRPTAGGFGDDFYCSECVVWEIRLHLRGVRL